MNRQIRRASIMSSAFSAHAVAVHKKSSSVLPEQLHEIWGSLPLSSGLPNHVVMPPSGLRCHAVACRIICCMSYAAAARPQLAASVLSDQMPQLSGSFGPLLDEVRTTLGAQATALLTLDGTLQALDIQSGKRMRQLQRKASLVEAAVRELEDTVRLLG